MCNIKWKYGIRLPIQQWIFHIPHVSLPVVIRFMEFV